METIVGKGGRGVIIINEENPNFVTKFAFNVASCNNLDDEFNAQLTAYNGWNSFEWPSKYGINAKILKPTNFKSFNGDQCSIMMSRIFPPDSSGLLWQLYLGGDRDLNMNVSDVNFIRGSYKGQNTLGKELNIGNKELTFMAYLSGLLIGTVQYTSRLTGLDTELVLGKENRETEILTMYLIDYDQSWSWSSGIHPITQIPLTERVIIKNLEWALSAEEYYPAPEDPLYSYFKVGYLEAAVMANLEDLANKVLERYEA